MGIEIHVDPAKQLTIFTGSGELTYDDIMKSIKSFYTADPTLNALFDLSHASVHSLSSQQIEQIAELLQTLRIARKGGRTAIVATTDLNYGLARMFEVRATYSYYGPSVKTEVFRDIKEATDWLCRGRWCNI